MWIRSPSRSISERAALIGFACLLGWQDPAFAGSTQAALTVTATVVDSARILIERHAPSPAMALPNNLAAAAAHMGMIRVVCTGAGGPAMALEGSGTVMPPRAVAEQPVRASEGAASTYSLPLTTSGGASAAPRPLPDDSAVAMADGTITVSIDF
jgi:hypothetical protein